VTIQRVALVVLLLAAGFSALWLLAPAYVIEDHRAPLRAALLDHTVLDTTYSKHQGVVWLFRHLGIHTHDGRPHDRTRDYVGAHPERPENSRPLAPKDLASVDLLYIADAHGTGARAPLSGLSKDAADLTAAFVRAGGSAVVEFNTLGPPTGPAARARLEEILAIATTGWVGRVFADPSLDDDVAPWLAKKWRDAYPDMQRDAQPALVLVHQSGKLLVFRGSLSAVTPVVAFTRMAETRVGLQKSMPPYFGWFRIVTKTPRSQILATLHFPHPGARAALAKENVRVAIFAAENTWGKGRTLYLAGDASDVDFEPPPLGSAHAGALAFLNDRSLPGGISREPLFWNVTVPLLSAWLKSANKRN